MRRSLSVVLAASLLWAAGCAPAPQRRGGAEGGLDREQIKKQVAEELHSEDMKDYIASQVRSLASAEMLEKSLDTEDGKKVLNEAVKTHLESAVGREQLEEAIMRLVEKPEVRQAIQQAARNAILELMARGAGGGQQQGGGGQQ